MLQIGSGSSDYSETIFLFLNENIYCYLSLEPSCETDVMRDDTVSFNEKEGKSPLNCQCYRFLSGTL